MAANTIQCQEHQMAQLSAVQDETHVTLHQLIDGMNALAFNASSAGRDCYVGCGYGGRRYCRRRMQGRGRGPPAYDGGIPQVGGFPQGGISPTMGTVGSPMGAPPGPPGYFQGGDAGGPPPYCAPPAMNGRYGPTGGYGMQPKQTDMSPGAQANVQPHIQMLSNAIPIGMFATRATLTSATDTRVCRACPTWVRQHIR
jgi:hypothetical protein